jgi:hypothetical protein
VSRTLSRHGKDEGIIGKPSEIIFCPRHKWECGIEICWEELGHEDVH